MSTSHLTFDGLWAPCENQADCASPVHVDMSAPEAATLPEAFIETLAEAADPSPGSWYGTGGGKAWYNSTGRLHRDYGLPALIQAGGARTWMQHGLEQRAHDRPARIQSDGTRIWYQRGERHRDGGKPALIRADSTRQWWVRGKQVWPEEDQSDLHETIQAPVAQQAGDSALNTSNYAPISTVPAAQYNRRRKAFRLLLFCLTLLGIGTAFILAAAITR